IMVEDSVPTASFTYSPPSPLEGDPVAFDASGSIGYDQPLSYSWNFGDDSSGAGVNPTHIYAQNGDYLVTLTVTDADGDSDSTSLTITVIDKEPTADFEASPTSGVEPLLVNFEDSSASHDGIVGWTWNFGDGQSSTDRNPTHNYVDSGVFTVSLTVVEGDGDGDFETKTSYITVADTAPSADFTASPTGEALTVGFTDTSTSHDGIVSWLWDFGDGETSSGQNPTHKFPDDGTYLVTLTVTDSDGSADTVTKQVSVVNTAPTANFSIVSSAKPTINEEISFIDQSSDPDGNIISWYWDLGDGTTATTKNATHRYQALGTYIVNLTVTDNDGASDTLTKSVTIFDVTPPVTTDNYDGAWHTSDFTINLTATDDLTGVAETYYSINDGTIRTVSIDGQPRIATESAVNKLEYWSVDKSGNEELPHKILTEIKLDKTNPFADAGSNQSVDEDQPVTFDGSSSFDNIGITSYTWTFFDKSHQTLTGPNPTYTFDTPGEYSVNLTVTDAALNYAVDTITITVRDQTLPVANAGDDLVAHEETQVIFNGSGSTDNVGIVSYVWTFVDETSRTLRGVNATYVFNTPGKYNATLTVSDAEGNSATDTVMITVVDATYPLANAGEDQVIDEDTMLTFNGSASYDNVGIMSYVWTFLDGTLQTLLGATPTYTFETPGVYRVTLNVTDAEAHFTADTMLVTVRDITPPLANIGSYATVVELAPVNFDASECYDNVAIVHYRWNFGDGTLENSTVPSVVHTYTKPGVYIVALTVIDEAGNTDSTAISVVAYRDTDGDLIADHLDSDDDNDGMSDDWEIIHGLDPLDPSDADLDPDGDSLSNIAEYQIGSDPNVYTSPSPFPVSAVLILILVCLIIALGVLFMRKL
ncbi:MAG: PKD domain-containing protein, partial [Candidatus Bathyarchaeota archaeon]